MKALTWVRTDMDSRILFPLAFNLLLPVSDLLATIYPPWLSTALPGMMD